MKRHLDRFRLRIRSLVAGDKVDARMKDELDVHIEEQVDNYIAGGMDPREARLAAMRDFGPVDRIEEECRDTRRVALVENLLLDLRYSFRSLVAQPLLLAAAATSIAVAIGANTTIFGLATSLLMVTPTAREPERLAHIRMRSGSHVSHGSGAICRERRACRPDWVQRRGEHQLARRRPFGQPVAALRHREFLRRAWCADGDGPRLQRE